MSTVKSLLEFLDHVLASPRFKKTGTQHRTEIGLQSDAHSLFPKISSSPYEKLKLAILVFKIICIKINIFIMKIVDSILVDGAW